MEIKTFLFPISCLESTQNGSNKYVDASSFVAIYLGVGAFISLKYSPKRIFFGNERHKIWHIMGACVATRVNRMPAFWEYPPPPTPWLPILSIHIPLISKLCYVITDPWIKRNTEIYIYIFRSVEYGRKRRQTSIWKLVRSQNILKNALKIEFMVLSKMEIFISRDVKTKYMKLLWLKLRSMMNLNIHMVCAQVWKNFGHFKITWYSNSRIFRTWVVCTKF